MNRSLFKENAGAFLTIIAIKRNLNSVSERFFNSSFCGLIRKKCPTKHHLEKKAHFQLDKLLTILLKTLLKFF